MGATLQQDQCQAKPLQTPLGQKRALEFLASLYSAWGQEGSPHVSLAGLHSIVEVGMLRAAFRIFDQDADGPAFL